MISATAQLFLETYFAFILEITFVCTNQCLIELNCVMDQMQKDQLQQKLVELPQQTENLHSKVEQDRNLSINEALIRFKQLNSQYLVQVPTDLLCERDYKNKLGKGNKKVDNFTIMTKLRHLENAALLNRADHEIGVREKKKNESPNKSMRKKRTWLKFENTLNQPYLKTYNNFLRSQKEEQEIIMKHYLHGNQTPDLSSDSQISQDEQPFRKWLNFSKQLKPYRKIVQYTKQKIQIKNSFRNQCCIQTRKAESLQQLRSAHKYQAYKQYSQVQKKLTTSDESKQLIDKQTLAKRLFENKMSKIYKKTSNSQNNSYQKSKQRNNVQENNFSQQTYFRRRVENQKTNMSGIKFSRTKEKNLEDKTYQKFSRSLDLRKIKQPSF